jgi:hypothetical protein
MIKEARKTISTVLSVLQDMEHSGGYDAKVFEESETMVGNVTMCVYAYKNTFLAIYKDIAKALRVPTTSVNADITSTSENILQSYCSISNETTRLIVQANALIKKIGTHIAATVIDAASANATATDAATDVVTTVDVVTTADVAEDEVECPICFGSAHDVEMTKTPCGHVICNDCLDYLTEKNKTCHMCRQSLG